MLPPPPLPPATPHLTLHLLEVTSTCQLPPPTRHLSPITCHPTCHLAQVEDPNYDKRQVPPGESRAAATPSKDNLGCFGASKNKVNTTQPSPALTLTLHLHPAPPSPQS